VESAAPSPAQAAMPPSPSASASASPLPTDDVPPTPSNIPPGWDFSVVQSVYKSHKAELRDHCWVKAKTPPTEKVYEGSTKIRIAPDGHVLESKTESPEPMDGIVSVCVDNAIKKWKFPAPKGTASVTMHVRLIRD
jgi:hypothetical protein